MAIYITSRGVMISLHNMWFLNASIISALSAELIAVFVKVMNRIGKTTLKQFVKHVCQFCFYFLNHSHKVEDHIAADCKVLNIKNQFIFIKTDMSLICTVNKVCQNIKRKEKLVNLLFLTQGSLIVNVYTFAILFYYLRKNTAICLYKEQFTRVK